MPVYNAAEYIMQSVESVINQTYTMWELIIIDDHSSDGSLDVISNYLKDSRIRISINKSNLGAAAARNKGISKAKGTFISFLDSDDLWFERKLEKQIEFMTRNNYDFSYSYFDLVDKKSKKLNKYRIAPLKITYKSTLISNKIGCLTVLVKSIIAKDIEIDSRISKRNDYALWLKYLKKTDGFCLPEILASYRIDSGVISNTRKTTLLKYHFKVFRISEGFGFFKSIWYTFLNGFGYLVNSLVLYKNVRNSKN